MPTIKDVAREAGVSIATVSYVLNNKSESISEETRQVVLEAATRIGYTPNVTARNLRFSQTRLIGYAWHAVPGNQVNPVMDQFTYHLAHAAEDCGYHVLTFTHPPRDPAPVYDELIQMRRLDAFVLAEISIDDHRIALLQQRRFPFACFGRLPGEDNNFPWVDVDGRQGVYDAVAHLVELGHRRIAMVAWDDTAATAQNRLIGYQQAMRDFGLPVPDHYIYAGLHSEETGRRALLRWQELPADERPTAVVAISDLEAIGVMNEAEAQGLVIGETLSVVGFDDVPLSRYLRPALTTLRQPIPDVARALVKILIEVLDRRQPTENQVLLRPLLQKRASCGPPR